MAKEIIITYWEESEQREALANKCSLFQKTTGGSRWWQQCKPRKIGKNLKVQPKSKIQKSQFRICR